MNVQLPNLAHQVLVEELDCYPSLYKFLISLSSIIGVHVADNDAFHAGLDKSVRARNLPRASFGARLKGCEDGRPLPLSGGQSFLCQNRELSVIVSNHLATVSALNAPVARYDHTANERAGAFFAYAIAIIFRLSSRLFDRAFHVGSIA